MFSPLSISPAQLLRRRLRNVLNDSTRSHHYRQLFSTTSSWTSHEFRQQYDIQPKEEKLVVKLQNYSSSNLCHLYCKKNHRRRSYTTTTHLSSYSSTSMYQPMKLHTEWIPASSKNNTATTKYDNNNSDVMDDENAYSVLFLHGLLGNGRNLKTFAKNVIQRKQQQQQETEKNCLGGLLMDLRGHGKSFSMLVEQQHEQQQHQHDQEQKRSITFQHCVQDVQHTLDEYDVDNTNGRAIPPSIVVGHSWGGRLALEYAVAACQNGRPLESLWLLDTVPGQAHESVDQVLSAVSDIIGKNNDKTDTMDRKELVNALSNEYGIDPGVAQWLASSYNNRTGDFGFDLKLVQGLKPEFANQDFVGLLRIILEHNNKKMNTINSTKIHLVRGGKNTAWSIQILSELEALAKEFPTTFYLHVLPLAGHWVHVDDQAGLIDLFTRHS